MYTFNDFEILIAGEEHIKYAKSISDMIVNAALHESAGLALRTPEYLEEKILAGKAVIALFENEIAGFCYIELWDQKQFIANSGLIVAKAYREMGLATQIKKVVFKISREKYPEAKIFGLTTNAAVMKINSFLGYRPVIYNSLTTDPDFWEGCKSCSNYDILQRTLYQRCLCTGMVFNPFEFNIEDEFKLNKKSVELLS